MTLRVKKKNKLLVKLTDSELLRLKNCVLSYNSKLKMEDLKGWSQNRLLANCHPSDRIDFEIEFGERPRFQREGW